MAVYNWYYFNYSLLIPVGETIFCSSAGALVKGNTKVGLIPNKHVFRLASLTLSQPIQTQGKHAHDTKNPFLQQKVQPCNAEKN